MSTNTGDPQQFPEAKAAEFEEHGFDRHQATPWITNGFAAEQAGRWRALGFDAAEAILWRDAEMSLADARWARRAGLSLAGAVEEARRWRDAGFGPTATERLKDLRFDLAKRDAWTSAGVSPADVPDWVAAGAGPKEAIAWRAQHFGPGDFERAQRVSRSLEESIEARERATEADAARQREAAELARGVVDEERRARALEDQIAAEWSAAGASDGLRRRWIGRGWSVGQYVLALARRTDSSEPKEPAREVPTVLVDDGDDHAAWEDGSRLPAAVDTLVGTGPKRRRALERLGFRVLPRSRQRFVDGGNLVVEVDPDGSARRLLRVRRISDEQVVAEEFVEPSDIVTHGATTDERSAVVLLADTLHESRARPKRAVARSAQLVESLDWLEPLLHIFPKLRISSNDHELTWTLDPVDGTKLLLPSSLSRWPVTREFDDVVLRLGGRVWLSQGAEPVFIGRVSDPTSLTARIAELPAIRLVRESYDERSEILVSRDDSAFVMTVDGEPLASHPSLRRLVAERPELHLVRPGESFDLRFVPMHGLDTSDLRTMLTLDDTTERYGDEHPEGPSLEGATNFPISINGAQWMFADIPDGTRLLLPRPDWSGFSESAFIRPLASFSAIENGSMTSGTQTDELAYAPEDRLTLELTIGEGGNDLTIQRRQIDDPLRAIVEWASNLHHLSLEALAEAVIGRSDEITADLLDDDGSASLEIGAWASASPDELVDFLNAQGHTWLVDRYAEGRPEFLEHRQRRDRAWGYQNLDEDDDE